MEGPHQLELGSLVPPETFDKAAEAIKADLGEQGGGRLKRAIAGLAASRIGNAMAAKFREIDLLPLFAKGWGNSPEVRAAAAESKDLPQPKFVRLGKFEQDLDLYPLLTVSAWGVESSPIRLTLTLKAEFDAVEVGLSKGYIAEIGGGICELSALLKCGSFSFPAGIAPIEWQLGSGRRFAAPGLALAGTDDKKAG